MTGSPLSSFGLSTVEMDEIFEPASFVSAMLEFEGALALALADTGIAPPEEATAVAAACKEPVSVGLLDETWRTGTPVIALTAEIEDRLQTDHERRWVHHGATTQDVMDTAQMLLVRRGLEALESHLTPIATDLKELITTHRGQAQIGRTFLQHAQPTLFSHRAAGWLSSILGHIEPMRETRAGLPVQLGGPVGNLDSYGVKGNDVVAALAERLGLRAPDISWHTDRSAIWKVVWAVDRPVASIAKLAGDVALLAQSDIAELKVRAGGSSSMEHKRNPIDAIRALAAADICHGAAEMILGARPHELDRSVGAWQVEWVAIPLLFRSAGAALEAAGSLVSTMEIDGRAMSERLDPDQEEALGHLDPSQIERVLDSYERVMEGQ